jgi:hypothetical protein
MIDQAWLLENWTSIFKHNEVGNTLHLKAGRELRVGFGVDLQDDGLTGHISCGPGNLRSRRSAWATPTGPEVHQNGHCGVLDNVVEGCGIDGERFRQRRKLGLARSTSSGCT